MYKKKKKRIKETSTMLLWDQFHKEVNFWLCLRRVLFTTVPLLYSLGMNVVYNSTTIFFLYKNLSNRKQKKKKKKQNV